MIKDAKAILTSFQEVTSALKPLETMAEITHELLSAPHSPPPSYPFGFCASYVFSLSEEYGRHCPAGPNRVIKVGKVGANSGPRFTGQHYLPNSTNSNLAKSLINEKILWAYLGIDYLDESTVKTWMLANLERDHFFVPVAHAGTERELERYLRGRLGPVFEG